jgi:hypothetical protein
MKQAVPQIGSGPPILIASFKCWTYLVIQVVGPQTLYLAESMNAIQAQTDNGVIDALQINQATGIIGIWWKGDLYAAGSAAFTPIVGIPGVNTSSGLPGSNSTPDNVLPISTAGTL